ncbi:substrate-binding domain-containing protein [Oscillospiraceae bacterium PP1C4]
MHKIAVFISAAIFFLLPLTSCAEVMPSSGEAPVGKSDKSIESGASPEKKDGITIGFSIASVQEERWLTDREIFISKCNELGAEVIEQSANGDAQLQNEQCKKLLAQGIDVLVVIPLDSEKSAAIVNEANNLDIPVVAYDRLIRNSFVAAHVSYDNVKIGEFQARYLVDLVPEGNYMLLGGAQTDYCSIQVRKGQMKVLKPYIDSKKITIVETAWVEDWNPYIAKKVIEDVLAENQNNIQAIVASNDGTAGGAIQALAEQKLAGKVAVSGQDADLAGCQRIVEGIQSMTVYVPIKAEAEAAAEVAIKLARGGIVTGNSVTDNGKVKVPTILLEPILVDSENIVDTVIKDGYQKYEEVFKNIPVNSWPQQK